ncbi:hypothetical protein BB561_004720 [Smittium simulii]|uniref:Ubiquitin-like protease family profile domain-containing protein n=1 Tax=Smittium simulii TaxID=133385 RepID=A0A2T9YEL9_9FUNG|nr:hypothetical protein BB561_004720 [Smittium simulii]
MYLDSLLGKNDSCLMALLDYIDNESDIPVQKNGYDCGVFTAVFAEHASRGAEFIFSQQDMKYYRKKIMLEILSNQIY